MANTRTPIPATGNYPTNAGISVSPMGGTDCLMHYTYHVGGVPGSGATFQPQVLKKDGTWVNTGSALTAAGMVSGQCYGLATRLASNPGTSPGTGSSVPSMWGYITHRNVVPTKASSG